ncbi:MAG: hypothetical protein MUC90_01990 [Thermoplasmata archaeon]|nr:hypothetical protein [Thermoplasmata archaeon]
MRTKRSEDEDIPKLVASIMVAVPGLTLKSGFAYLRLRRKAHDSSKAMMNSMISEGIPEEYARKLSETYAADMSIKRFIRGAIGSSSGNPPKVPPRIPMFLL